MLGAKTQFLIHIITFQMLSLAQLKTGNKILFNNYPFEILTAQHTKMARSQGQARVKMKNLLTGSVLTHTFSGNQTLEKARVIFKPAQFLYRNQHKLVFMDPDNFEQIELNDQQLGSQSQWLKEEQKVNLVYWKNKAINLKLPTKIKLRVKEAEPGLRGDRQTAGTKKITLETGAIIDAPLFIKPGDKIIINTEKRKYAKRAK